MTSFDDAVSAVKHHSAAFQSVLRSWPAYLGDGEGNVVGSQVNYYHCRYPTPESPAIEVYANGCPPNDGQKVMIGNTADQPNLIQIVSWNDSALDDTVNDHVKNHADQHFYLGGDTVWVDWRQITTFRVQPYAGLTVYVEGGVLPRSGADLQVLPQIVDLTSSVPGTSGQARYALLSIDTTGAVVVTDGTTVSPVFVLDASDVPSTPAGNFRLAAVALQYGQTLVTESLLQRDILDLRWPQESMAGSGVVTPAMLANADAQYRYLVSGATPFAFALSPGKLNIASGKTLTVSNSITLTGTDGGTTALAVTSGKTLTLTAVDDFNIGFPASGTVALLGTANVFTTSQTISGAGLNVGTGASGAGNAQIAVGRAFSTHGGFNNVIDLNGGIAIQRTDDSLNQYAFAFFNTSGTVISRILVGSSSSKSLNFYNDVDSGEVNIFAVSAGGTVSRQFVVNNLSATVAVTPVSDKIQLNINGYTTQTNPILKATAANTGAGITNLVSFVSLGSGSDNDGGSVLMAGKSSTTAAQSMGMLEWYWPATGGATHASRFSAVALSAYSTTNKRTGLTVQADSVASVTTIGAAQAGAYTTTAINLTLTTAHHWVKVTAACTITLPTAVGISGREYSITATANSVIVDGDTTETISGALTVTLNTGDSLQIKSDGANWFII